MQPKEFWIDAQLPPAFANFLNYKFNVSAKNLSELGLRESGDYDIFSKAKEQNAIIITKDSDFVDLLLKFKSPPKILLITFGNTSNKELQRIFINCFNVALELLNKEDLVEISK